jgi:hypothetical protein
MYPKKSVLKRKVQKLDLQLGKDHWYNYQRFMAKVLEDFPDEVKHVVLGHLRSRNFEKLLEWADQFADTSHEGYASTHADKSHMGVELYRSTSQLVALIKKYPFPADHLKQSAKESAWEKFLHAEKRCKRYNLKFRSLETKTWDTHNDICFRMSNFISHVIGFTPDYEKIYELCNFGPGASIGIHGNSTNLGKKLLSDEWTCTPSALPFALTALARDQHVWELLIPKRAGYTCLDPKAFREEFLKKVRLVQHNKIVFVPKTTLVDRTIAVEPLLNGYLQKGVDVFMRQRLKKVRVYLSKQERNAHFAYLGSLPEQADPFVTIDLSSASDSISTEMVRRLLPFDWFIFMNQLRAKSYTTNDKEFTPYQKFVSMGNGFCFPLESLIFASVCSLYAEPGDFRVYGDDIIVRQSIAKQVLQTLWWLGFRHNPKKTFISGPFKESCGADWLEGHDVRPLTLDHPFDSLSEVIKFYNLSLQKDFWSSRFEGAREFLFNLVPPELRMCRPYKGSIFGAFEVPLDKFQGSPFSVWDRNTQAWMWLELDMVGRPDRDFDHAAERFHTVLTMAAVRGLPSHKPFSKRRETSRTIRVKSYAGAESTWLPPTPRL